MEIFLNIMIVWNIKTYFSKMKTLREKSFVQKVFQILNPLKDTVLDLNAKDVCWGVGRGQVSPICLFADLKYQD